MINTSSIGPGDDKIFRLNDDFPVISFVLLKVFFYIETIGSTQNKFSWRGLSFV